MKLILKVINARNAVFEMMKSWWGANEESVNLFS